MLEVVFYFYVVGSFVVYMFSDMYVMIDELFVVGVIFMLLVWGFVYSFVVL